ncbi:MAG: hypothetical protein KGR26_03285 [Cyanobacteria bacterium REEB65]|nr:hypothetical protein [Cyanobacteria bacterium REEB65]
MANTYLVELSDDARTGKLVVALPQSEIQRPAADFVFDFLGGEPAQVGATHSLGQADVKLLSRLQQIVFDRDEQGLIIREGVGFQANRAPLDPDASFEEYFLPRPDRPGDVHICEIEVQSGDPERARKRMMLAFQVMFVLHRSKRGYQTTMTDVDTLAPITDEAESKGLLRFDMAKETFILTEQGQKAYQSLVDEAQQLIARYDLYSDVDCGRDGTIRFQTGLGEDLRVPIWERNGINVFRARFVLGLNDGEWDELPNWPRRITDPRWFDEIFAPIEQAPTVEQVGSERCERIFDEGKRVLRGDGAVPAESYSTTQTTYDDGPGYGYYYRDPFISNSWWWMLFLL